MTIPTRVRAVITGGGSGLGRALALEVARRGGSVLVADIDDDGAAETVELVRRLGQTAHAVRCDVADAAEVDALLPAADNHLGGVDLIANNAGVGVGGITVEDTPLADWQWIMGINLWGVIHGCRTFVPRLRAQGHGGVLNVASAAAFVAPPMLGPYNVTKAGVVALSESLAAELRATGVRVTVLCPSFFKTNIHRSSRGGREPELEQAIERQMTRSKVQAPEVARAALEALDRGELYALPMRDARAMWALKRALPQRFSAALGSGRNAVLRALAVRAWLAERMP